MSDMNSRNIEGIVILPEKRQEIQVIKSKYFKMEHCRISKLLSNSTISKSVTRKLIKGMI